MSSSPDRELLTQAAARQLLERAGEIDADSTTVETLRAAAREAGISEAAFEAALVEIRGKLEHQPARPAPNWKRRYRAAMVTGALLVAAVVFVVIPRGVSVGAATAMVDHEIVVQCLPMKMAQKIATTVLRDEGNEIQMTLDSRVLRVRATPVQAKELQLLFVKTARGLSSCDNTPAK